MWKDSSTSTACPPPTSHGRNCCSIWLLRKVTYLGGIPFQAILPVLPLLLLDIATRLLHQPGTLGNLYRFGITLSWDPSFRYRYNFPYVLPTGNSRQTVDRLDREVKTCHQSFPIQGLTPAPTGIGNVPLFTNFHRRGIFYVGAPLQYRKQGSTVS
jgi:hypothetical protein